MEKYLNYINSNLSKVVSSIDDDNPIKEYIDYVLFPGGKRIRPLLCLLTYNMYSNAIDEMIGLATSIELIHSYSLVHDDLPCMDDDDYRRGKPSLHKKFGQAQAVLTGDALLNLAFEIAIEDILNSDEDIYIAKLRALKTIANGAGLNGMVYGQVLDIEGDTKDYSDLEFMYSKKTGDLIASSILAPAIVAEISDLEFQELKTFSKNLGLLFQLRDDIRDYEEDKEAGKQTIISNYNKEDAYKILYDHDDLCRKSINTLSSDFSRQVDGINELLDKLVEI